MAVNTSSTSQTCTKENISTNMPVKCLFIVWFWKLKALQKIGTLLYTSKLRSVSNLGAKISQIWLSRAVIPVLPELTNCFRRNDYTWMTHLCLTSITSYMYFSMNDYPQMIRSCFTGITSSFSMNDYLWMTHLCLQVLPELTNWFSMNA